MKKALSILLALLMLSAMLPAQAQMARSLVRYEGGAEAFVFLPGSEFDASDLFSGFKGVMPGDVCIQHIEIRNTTSQQVRIYLRAEPVAEKDAEFLSRLNLQVSARDGQIFDAAASETGQLTENTLLGTFKRAGSTTLTLTLTVPYDLGNEYMLSQGVVPWTFLVEEVIEEDTPHTGDYFDLGTWLLAAGMILAAIAWVLVQMKRQKAAEAN